MRPDVTRCATASEPTGQTSSGISPRFGRMIGMSLLESACVHASCELTVSGHSPPSGFRSPGVGRDIRSPWCAAVPTPRSSTSSSTKHARDSGHGENRQGARSRRRTPIGPRGPAAAREDGRLAGRVAGRDRPRSTRSRPPLPGYTIWGMPQRSSTPVSTQSTVRSTSGMRVRRTSWWAWWRTTRARGTRPRNAA